MEELLKLIPNCDRIIVYCRNHSIKSSRNADYFYNLVYNSYFIDKEYDRERITNNSNFRTRAYGGLLRKYLYLYVCLMPSSGAFYDADLLLLVDEYTITVMKSRYTSHNGIYNIKDLPIYQRKDKINKIIKRNEERITTYIT